MRKTDDKLITIADLIPDPENARHHDERNLEMITNSLRELGAGRSILLDRNNEIVCGNGVVQAAAAAGIEKVRVVEARGDEIIAVKRSDLTGRSKRRMALADNRAGELSYFIPDVLARFQADDSTILDGLFTAEEFSDLGGIGTISEPTEVDAEPQINRADALQAEWQVQRGDVWALGDHRLACADSSSEVAVARLMNGETAALFATDPPFGIDYVATKAGIPRTGYATLATDYSDITADNLKNEKLQAFLTAIFRAWMPCLERAGWYLWHAGLEQGFYVAAAATAVDVLLHRQLIWVKPGFNLTRSGMYHWAHENAYFGWVRGEQPPWYGEKNQRSVWEIDRIREKSAHPTCKPPELWHAPMQNHTKPGEICAEPFSGSGSQIIAAEQLGRRCFAMEVEEKYCAVALQRYVDATGKTPERIAT